MQLNLTTDYAIRMMRVLYEEGNLLTAHELGKKIGVTQGYIHKLTQNLKKAGYIKMQRGKMGGILPSQRATNVSLLDIVKATEPSLKICKCLEGDGMCSADCQKKCPERKHFEKIQLKIEEALDKVTFDMLIANSSN